MKIVPRFVIDYLEFSKAINEIQAIVGIQSAAMETIKKVRKALPKIYREKFDNDIRIAVKVGLHLNEAVGCAVDIVITKIEKAEQDARPN